MNTTDQDAFTREVMELREAKIISPQRGAAVSQCFQHAKINLRIAKTRVLEATLRMQQTETDSDHDELERQKIACGLAQLELDRSEILVDVVHDNTVAEKNGWTEYHRLHGGRGFGGKASLK